ncbi:MAG: hypothetical protein A2X82_13480 [Geobacteraceae bacterium GWC2_55_20]|nr:MAG: hypothetical protein A2X82_13480 [Geobacteraceae bacterium GWC2_55_20]OGU19328.1 MAG: hypothetical protein A2X85_03545 [Geobacteraceae bacterium GWF2_54_21]HBA71449.1 hypothetical protein [Geobacter sp.]HCE68032.1 hypothetical protein [Geobacter sp.]
MNRAMTLDPKFIQLATPVLSEFGFSGIKELVTDQLSMMILSKIAHYESETKLYESKYNKSFEVTSAQAKMIGSENFELDDDLNDWRFARESAELYRLKLQELQRA